MNGLALGNSLILACCIVAADCAGSDRVARDISSAIESAKTWSWPGLMPSSVRSATCRGGVFGWS
jgi:hypothetical protein